MTAPTVAPQQQTEAVEHLDFDYVPPCEEETCAHGHPPAVVVVTIDCPCPNDQAEGVALLCRKCLDGALEDGSICTGCEQYYPPGPPFRIVRWLT